MIFEMVVSMIWVNLRFAFLSVCFLTLRRAKKVKKFTTTSKKKKFWMKIWKIKSIIDTENHTNQP
jgi:hypothetical protein